MLLKVCYSPNLNHSAFLGVQNMKSNFLWPKSSPRIGLTKRWEELPHQENCGLWRQGGREGFQGENPSSDWSRILRCEQYPLVICYIAVERATFFHWKIKEHPLFQWSCSIAMLNYQRVHLEPDWYILRHNAFLSIANMISVLLLYNGRVQYGIYWYIGISNTQTKLDFSWWTK